MFRNKEEVRLEAIENCRFFLKQEIEAAVQRGARQIWLSDDIYVDQILVEELRASGYAVEAKETGEVKVSWDHE